MKETIDVGAVEAGTGPVFMAPDVFLATHDQATQFHVANAIIVTSSRSPKQTRIAMSAARLLTERASRIACGTTAAAGG